MVKKLLIATSLVLWIIGLKAQTDLSKWSLGFAASADVSYRFLTANSEVPQLLVDVWNDIEVPKPSFSIGVLPEYAVSENVHLHFGVIFSNNGYKIKKADITVDSLLQHPPIARKVRFNFQYIDIPFGVKFYLVKRKISFFIIPTAEANFLLRTNETFILYYPDDKEKTKIKDRDIDLMRRVNVSAKLALGVEIELNAKNKLFIQPTFKYMFLPHTKDTNIERTFYTGGLTLGLIFNP